MNAPRRARSRRYRPAFDCLERRDAPALTVGTAFQVNATMGGDHLFPVSAGSGNGTSVVVWDAGVDTGDATSDEQNQQVQARLLDAQGQPTGPTIAVSKVDIDVSGAQAVAMDRRGDWVVVWDQNDKTILAQRFSATGARQGPPLTIAAAPNSNVKLTHPDLAMDAAGNFVVTYIETKPHLIEVAARLYRADGQLRKALVVANSPLSFPSSWDASVAASPDGRFTVGAIQSVAAATSARNTLWAFRFSATGKQLGSTELPSSVNVNGPDQALAGAGPPVKTVMDSQGNAELAYTPDGLSVFATGVTATGRRRPTFTVEPEGDTPYDLSGLAFDPGSGRFVIGLAATGPLLEFTTSGKRLGTYQFPASVAENDASGITPTLSTVGSGTQTAFLLTYTNGQAYSGDPTTPGIQVVGQFGTF
jgi:hypothetical protein